jgi:hypothetical protein
MVTMELKYVLACVIRPILINKKLTVAILATLFVVKLFTALLLSRNSTHSPIDTAFLNLNAENIELNTDLKVSGLLELIYVVLNFFVVYKGLFARLKGSYANLHHRLQPNSAKMVANERAPRPVKISKKFKSTIIR